MEKVMKKGWVVFVCALICCTLWGSAFPCIKIGYQLFHIGGMDNVSQLLFAGLRFSIAGIMVILFGSILDRKVLYPKRKNWRYILSLCMFQTVGQYFFFYIGLARTTGVKSSIIMGSNVFLAILVAVFIYKLEKLTVKKVIGCIVGFLGVVLINLNGGSIDGSISLMGEGFIVFSAVCYAFSSALMKNYAAYENTVVLSGYQFFVGGIILSIAGFALGGRIEFEQVSTAGWGLLLYLAFISAFAYTLWGLLLKYNNVGKVAVYGFMNPVVGVILSALLLDEGGQAFGVEGIVALLLVCIGIFIVNSTKIGKKESSAA